MACCGKKTRALFDPGPVEDRMSGLSAQRAAASGRALACLERAEKLQTSRGLDAKWLILAYLQEAEHACGTNKGAARLLRDAQQAFRHGVTPDLGAIRAELARILNPDSKIRF